MNMDMKTRLLYINIVHIIIIAPFLLYIASYKDQPLPKSLANVLTWTAITVALYHSYKAYLKLQVK